MHIPTFVFIFILFRTNILLLLLYPKHVIKPLGNNLGCYSKPPIVHRDVKTSNILLDGKWEAKVADLGLSRFMPSESRILVSTKVAGTPGYLDPK